MNNHKSSRTTVYNREIILVRMINENARPADVARAFGISVRTVHKCLRRHRDKESPDLEHRSSAATSLWRKLPSAYEKLIMYLRRYFLMSARYIARNLKLARSTVAAVLKRHHMGTLKQLDSKEPVRRFERAAPRDLLHLDIKKLAKFDKPGHRITGNRRVNSRGVLWEWVHVCVDDYTRLSYVVVCRRMSMCCRTRRLKPKLPSWSGPLSTSKNLGVPVNEVMADNGTCYRSKVFQKICERFNFRHLSTRPYRPQTNGKAERFKHTLIYEWAYTREYQSSDERKGHLRRWVLYYNQVREHGSLGDGPPITKK